MIRKKLIILSFAAVYLHGSAACPPETTTANPLFREGLDHSYSWEYEQAIEAFDRYIAIHPDDPVGYWRKLIAQYFLYRDEQHGDDTPKLTRDQFKAVVTLANNAISRAKADADQGLCPDFNRYVAASALSFRALFEIKNTFILAGRPRATTMEAIGLASQSKYQDVGLLLGTINYELASHGHLVQMVSHLPHDKEAGRRMIFEASAQNDSPFVDDVWIMIFKIERDKNNVGMYAETEIENVWRHLFEKYPRNRSLIEFKASHHL